MDNAFLFAGFPQNLDMSILGLCEFLHACPLPQRHELLVIKGCSSVNIHKFSSLFCALLLECHL